MMPTGKFASVRPATEVERRLAGLTIIRRGDAARALGVTAESIETWTAAGLLAFQWSGAQRAYTAADLIEFAAVYHSSNGDREYRLLERLTPLGQDDASARSTVLRMINTWHDCETVQQLHDAAGVGPLPPTDDDYTTRKPLDTEDVTCARCGATYSRPIESSARWSLCRSCTSRVRQRAARLAREYMAWRNTAGG